MLSPVFALLLALLGVPPIAARAERLEAELSGGARLLFEARPAAKSADLIFVLRAGWHEADPEAALAARALAPRTRELDAAALAAEANRRQLTFQFEVQGDLTVARATGPGTQVLWMAEALAEWLREAPYDAPVLVAPLPETNGLDALRRAAAPALWPAGSTLARPAPTGTVSAEAQVAHHRRRLGPSVLVIGLRGPFGAEPTAQRLADLLAPCPAPAEPMAQVAGNWRPAAGRELWIRDVPDAARARILLMWPGPKELQTGEVPASLWRYTVAGPRLEPIARSFGGRILLEGGSDAKSPRTQPFEIGLEVPHERVPDAIGALWNAVEAALAETTAPTGEELSFFRNQARQMAQMGSARPDGSLDLAVRQVALGLGSNHFERRLEALGADGSAADVLATARAVVDLENLRIVVEGPGDTIAAALSQRELPLSYEGPRWLGAPPSSAGGLAEGERLLAALGGREAWAAVRHIATQTRFVLERDGRRNAVESRQLRAFDDLALRLEQQHGEQRLGTVLVSDPLLLGPHAWRQTPTGVERLDAPTTAQLLEGERRALVRLVARLARGELGATVQEDGRLALADSAGECARLELDADGRPRALYLPAAGGELSVRFEEWSDVGGLVYAQRYRMEGSLPRDYEVLRFDPAPQLDGGEFAAPQ